MQMGAADFDNICLFLAEFQWVYNFRLTHFFIDEVWKHVPEEWMEYLLSMTVDELSQVPSGKLKEGWPESFHAFVKKSLLYSSICTHAVSTIDSLDQICINGQIKRGMTPKKLHEVCHMTSLVDHVTRESGAEVIVDVGSGLGYLGQVLHDEFHYPVLGLESQSGHTSGAEQRARHIEKCYFLRNSTYELRCDPESQQNLQTLLIDWFSKFDTEQCDCHFNSRSSKKKSSHSIKETKAQSSKELYDCDPNLIPFLSDLSQSKDMQSDIKENDSSSVFHTLDSSAEKLMPLAKFTQNREKFKISGKDVMCNKCHGSLSSKTIYDTNLVNSHENTKTPVNEECINSIPVTCDIDGNDLAASKRINRNTVDDGTVLSQNDKDGNKIVESEDGRHAYCNKNKGLPTNNITRTLLVMPKSCMIGLHCCGDLTPAMLKCFASEDSVRALCCVSCCYHRMKYDESLKEFSMFPMSTALETAMDIACEKFPGWSVGTYGLRLAAQETRTRWERQTVDDHALHLKNVAYRALLQLCVKKCDLVLKKSVRKIAHRADFSTFDNYVGAVTKHIHTDNAHTLQTFKEEMTRLYDEYCPCFEYIQPLTLLQVLLQPVLESLIHADRKAWLLERGFHSNMVPIFDDLISPRNLALIAIKS
ncbi:hypothetical protein ACJMK2_024568 [Sinanodonta woodiana]|uniref:Methyltransferase domain-containing protein n=1 Tax=Sinanodonta woodiana TaxID=1069815 RepID=A0ABD3XDT0_SINWO